MGRKLYKVAVKVSLKIISALIGCKMCNTLLYVLFLALKPSFTLKNIQLILLVLVIRFYWFYTKLQNLKIWFMSNRYKV